MTKQQENLRILHVVDREGGDTRLVAEINENWMLNLRVQQYAGFDFRDVASVAICGADLCSMLNRYRGQLERQVQTGCPDISTGLEKETGPKPADGSVHDAIMTDAERVRSSDGNDIDTMR
jgi:hypothetical protein